MAHLAEDQGSDARFKTTKEGYEDLDSKDNELNTAANNSENLDMEAAAITESSALARYYHLLSSHPCWPAAVESVTEVVNDDRQLVRAFWITLAILALFELVFLFVLYMGL
ncbi:hypothetical protein QOT17_009528 [Balamuthia mandrillaris]